MRVILVCVSQVNNFFSIGLPFCIAMRHSGPKLPFSKNETNSSRELGIIGFNFTTVRKDVHVLEYKLARMTVIRSQRPNIKRMNKRFALIPICSWLPPYENENYLYEHKEFTNLLPC